jgi:hypothetical protein
MERLDAVQALHSPLKSDQEWLEYMRDAMATNEVLVSPRRALELAASPVELHKTLGRVTEKFMRSDGREIKFRKGFTREQILDVEQGFDEIGEMRELWRSGKMRDKDVVASMSWSVLSNSLEAFKHESAFLDIMAQGIEHHVDEAVAGRFSMKSKGWTEFVDTFKKRAEKKDASGGANRNLEDNVGKFLNFVSQTSRTGIKDGKYKGQKFTEVVRNLYRRGNLDPTDPEFLSAKLVRREVMSAASGVGFGPKLLSFHMLINGMDDVMVLDRHQTRHMWDATPDKVRKNYGLSDIYDKRSPDQGRLVTDLEGARGLAITEAIEDGLREQVNTWYQQNGIRGSLGRFHWETWMKMLEAEASHKTLGILKDLPSAQSWDKAIHGYGARQGTFLKLNYGAEVTYLPVVEGGNQRWLIQTTTDGTKYKFLPDQYESLKKEIETRITKNKDNPINQERVLDHGFNLEAARENLGRPAPFPQLPGVNRENLDAAIRRHATDTLSPDELRLIQKASGGVDALADRGRLRELAEVNAETLTQTTRGTGLIQGATQFQKDGSAVIHLFQNENPTTIMHEFAHIVRRDMDPESTRVIERWLKIKNGNWGGVRGKNAEERFARGFEKYLREGKAPTGVLEDVFNDIEVQFKDAYVRMAGSDINVRMPDEARQVFDNLLGKEVLPEDPAHIKLIEDVIGNDEEMNVLRRAQQWSGKVFGAHGTLMKYNKRMGNGIENNARIAHWLAKMTGTRKPIERVIGEKLLGEERVEGLLGPSKATALSPEHAAQSVKKYLFDYDELTDFEREVARNIIPFYTWMRKNIPLQLEAIVTDPGRYAKIPKFIRAVESITDEWQDIETPDYFAELHAVKLPLIMGGKPVYYNPNLPFQDLNRLNAKDILSSMTPFVKIATEYFPERGYSLFLDRPIERYPGEPSGLVTGAQKAGLDPDTIDLIPDMLLPKTKKGEQLQATFLPPLAKVESALRAAGATNPNRGTDYTRLAANLAGQFLGVKVMPQDVRANTMGRKETERKILEDSRKRARALGIKLPELERSVKKRRE